MADDEIISYHVLLRLAAISLLWIEFCFTSWLKLRQIQKISSQPDIPQSLSEFVYDINDFRKAASYNKQLLLYTLFSNLYLTVVWTAIGSSKMIYFIWSLNFLENFDILPTKYFSVEIRKNVSFSICCIIIRNVLKYPILFYNIFHLEKKFGFYSSSRKHWTKVYMKKALLEILTEPILLGIIGWGLKTVDSLLINGDWTQLIFLSALYWLLFPSACLIANLATAKTKGLPEGELKTRIFALVDIVQFPRECVFVSSKLTGTTHSNAFQFSFLAYKRLILYSTMIEGYVGVPNGVGLSPALVEAVTAHELGHYTLSHSIATITFIQLEVFVSIIAHVWLMRQHIIYTSFGFPASLSGEKIAILPGLLISSKLLLRAPFFIVDTLFHIYSRKLEYKADEFAASLGYGKNLQKALVKISVDNCIFPDSDHLYSFFTTTHPSITERIDNINSYEPPIAK